MRIWKIMHIHKFINYLTIRFEPPQLEQQWKFKTSILPNVELY